MIQTEERSQLAPASKRVGIIDCDVHPGPKHIDEIKAHLEQPWRDRYSGGGRGFFGNPVHGARLDSKPPSGGGPGTDPEFLRRQLIDTYGMAHAILLHAPSATCSQIPISALPLPLPTTTG